MSTSLLQHKILLLRENFRAQPEIEFLNCVIANIKHTDYSPTIAQYYNLRLSMIIRKHATAWKIKQCASFFLPCVYYFKTLRLSILKLSAALNDHFVTSMCMRHKKRSCVLRNTRNESRRNTKSAHEIVLVL